MRRILRDMRRLLRSNRVWIRNTRFLFLALFNQRILVLRPSRRDWGTPARVGLAFEELPLRAGRDSLRAWWVPRDGATATVLLFPGRASNVSQELDALHYVWSLGANVLAFDYPGFGTSEGRATEQGCHAAAHAAWEALLARGVDPRAVILYGRSLGAAVAARLATQVACRALVFHGCASSMGDLRDHHLPRWVTKIRRLSIPLDSTKTVALARCPVIVVHAREDWLVPIHLARRVFDAACEPKRMIEVSGGHVDGNWLNDHTLRAEWQRLVSRSWDRPQGAGADESSIAPWSPPTRIAPESVSDDLDSVAVETGPLPPGGFVERLAALVTLVQRHAGMPRVTIGVTLPDAGFDLPLPMTISDVRDLASELDRLRRHAAVPFDRLLAILRPERVPGRHPLYEITLASGSIPPAPPRARSDLELLVSDRLATLTYRAALWPPEWARAFLDQYAQLASDLNARTPALLEPVDAPPGDCTLTPHAARLRIARALRAKPLSGVAAVVFTGEPATDGLIARWRALFPSEAPLFTVYEQACVYRVAEPPLRGMQPIGRPLHGVDVRVLAINGDDCAAGEIGALVIRGAPTGDLARIRSDGNIELRGRTDRRAWIGGELVDVAAIERERREALEVATGVDGEPRIRAVKPKQERAFVAPRDPVELQLTRIWEVLLECDGIGVTDDFFALGGESIIAVDLLARVESQFGVRLEPSVLLPDATIEHLAHAIRHSRAPDCSPLVTIQRGVGAPLVCVHPSGGSILCYVDLARLMGSDRAVIGIKGPDPRSSETPAPHAADMAAHYIGALRAAQPNGPYVLAGYSFGGLIAYEMAQQLAGEARVVALLDTRFPRAYGPEDRNPVVDLGAVLERYDLDSPQVAETDEHELWRELIELTSRYIPHEKRRRGRSLSSVQEFCRIYRLMPSADDVGYHDLRRFLRNLRANFRTMRHYVPAQTATPVMLFSATRTVDDRESDHLRNASLWSEVAPRLEVRRVEATHFNLLAPPSVQTLAASLGKLLP